MRFAHIVRKNKNSETPSRACWVSIKYRIVNKRGKESQYDFEYGWLRTGEKMSRTGVWLYRDYRASTALELLRRIVDFSRDKTRTYVWISESRIVVAMLDTFTRLFEWGWRCTLAVIECPPLLAKWRKGTRSLQLCAMENVWPMQYIDTSDGSKTAEQWGAANIETGHELEQPAKLKAAQMARQCTDWWTFLKANDLGGFSPTAASQAMRTFRHKYMTDEIFIDVNTPALELARAAYSGGRTECLHIGKMQGEFYLLDVNSMYAAVMHNMDVPVKLAWYTERATIEDIKRWAHTRVLVVDCDIETALPMFAVRESGHLTFPVGRFRAVLSGKEVDWALQHDCVRHVYRASGYTSRSAFRAYVASFWAERQAARARGDHAGAAKYKLLLASFYGKWGQGGGLWEKVADAKDSTIKVWTEVDFHTQEVIEWRQFGGIVQRRNNQPESYDSHPAIAATICANARMVLWAYMVSAGLENTFYVDTDSLLVNRLGFERLWQYLAPDALGGLRLEGQYADINIRAAKDYVFDNRQRHKGVSRQALAISNLEIEQTETMGLQALMCSGDISVARAKRVRRVFTRRYDKGTVLPSGQVVPLRRG